MLRHMRTTMIINDELYRQVKARALAEDRTVTSFVEAALRASLSGASTGSGAVDVSLMPPTGVGGEGPQFDMTSTSRLLEELDGDLPWDERH